jgi:hypothetical protein
MLVWNLPSLMFFFYFDGVSPRHAQATAWDQCLTEDFNDKEKKRLNTSIPLILV